MNECSNSFLVLVQKAVCGFRQVFGEEVSVLKTQVLVDGAVENHVGLIFDVARSTLKACAFMARGLCRLRQVAFPFNAKIMATGSETAQSNAVFAICDLKQVRCWLIKW